MKSKSLWKNYPYVVLMSGQFISLLGNSLFAIALPWYVYIATGSKKDLAVAGFLNVVPTVMGLLVGVWVDRWKKKMVMLISDVIRMLISVAMFVITDIRLPLFLFFTSVLLMRMVGMFFGPAESALLPLVVDAEGLPRAAGINKSASSLAQLIGSFGGGAIVSFVSPAILFLVNAVSFLVSVISLITLHINESLSVPTHRNFRQEWWDGISYVIQKRVWLRIVIVSMLSNLAFSAFDVVLTAWVKGSLRAPGYIFGSCAFALFLGMIIGGVLVGTVSRVLKLERIIAIGVFVSGCAVAAIPLIWQAAWTILLLLILGFAAGIMNATLQAYAYRILPADMRGRAFSILGAPSMISFPVGMFIYGLLLAVLPTPIVVALLGVPPIMAGIVATWNVRQAAVEESLQQRAQHRI